MVRESNMIPDEMKTIPNWVLWKSDKNPYSAITGGRASSTNPGTWVSYEQAIQACTDEYKGVGFVFTLETGIIFIDIDSCIDEDGAYSEIALDIISAFVCRPYIEVSQSGTGLHIFTFGTIPRSFNNRKKGVEMYSEKHYCALTGNGKGMLYHDQKAIDDIFNDYKNGERVSRKLSVPESIIDFSDAEIISKACKNEKFNMLWSGNDSFYRSRSEADAALCVKLAFWTDCNVERIDRLFRSSGLYRPKWDRDDYRKRTIENACGCCEETFSEYLIRKKREDASRYERYARGL